MMMYLNEPLPNLSSTATGETSHFALMCHKNEADRICDALLSSPNQKDDTWPTLVSMGNDSRSFLELNRPTNYSHATTSKCTVIPLPVEKGRRMSRQGYSLVVLNGSPMSPVDLPAFARKQISWAGRLTHQTYYVSSSSEHHIEQYTSEEYILDDVGSSMSSIFISASREIYKQLESNHSFDAYGDLLRMDVRPKKFNAEVCEALQIAVHDCRQSRCVDSQRSLEENTGVIKLTYSASLARNIVTFVVCSLPPQSQCCTSTHKVYWGISSKEQHWDDLNRKLNDYASKEVILESTDSKTGLDSQYEAVPKSVPVSRAYYKLAQVFQDRDVLKHISSIHRPEIYPNDIDNLLTHGSGLDVGASPGGWTQVLHTLRLPIIVAVDPAVLPHRVAILTGVHHVRADVCSEEAKQMIAQHAPFSVVVCDACVGVSTVFTGIAEALEGAASLLKCHHSSKTLFSWPLCFVITLKLPFKTKGSISRHVEGSKQIIVNFFRQMTELGLNGECSPSNNVVVKYKVLHLFANSISERCVVAIFNKA